MCNAFAAWGHEVTLLVTDRASDISEEPTVFFGVPLNFTVVRIAVPDIAGRATSIPVFLRPFLFQIQRFVFAYRAAAYLKRHMHTRLYGRDEWVLWFMSFFCGISITWESHEARYSYAARRLLVRTLPIVVISEGIRDFYVGHGVAKEKIHIAHDAVDARFFEPSVSTESARRHLGITAEKPVVMYIGGLESWKGAHTLFEAARMQEEFCVYVVGGKADEIVRMREKYPHVQFLGPRPYRELPVVQQAADVLVIPNTGTVALSAHYTSPLKLFSYMTSKKPIIASRIPSITNVLTDEEAFFFTADDANDLRDTIIRALHATHEGEEKVARAHKKSSAYTWEGRAQDILNCIGTVR